MAELSPLSHCVILLGSLENLGEKLSVQSLELGLYYQIYSRSTWFGQPEYFLIFKILHYTELLLCHCKVFSPLRQKLTMKNISKGNMTRLIFQPTLSTLYIQMDHTAFIQISLPLHYIFVI